MQHVLGNSFLPKESNKNKMLQPTRSNPNSTAAFPAGITELVEGPSGSLWVLAGGEIWLPSTDTNLQLLLEAYYLQILVTNIAILSRNDMGIIQHMEKNIKPPYSLMLKVNSVKKKIELHKLFFCIQMLPLKTMQLQYLSPLSSSSSKPNIGKNNILSFA